MSRSPSLVFDSRQLSEGCQCQHHHKSHSTLSLLFAPSPTKTIQRISRSRLPTLSVVICLFALLADAAALPRGPPKVQPNYQKRHLVRAGDSLRLTCPIEPDSEALVDWAKDSETIHLGWSRFRLTRNSLLIKDLEAADTGVYVCKATNGFGSIDAIFQVYVYAQRNATGSPPYVDFDEFFKESSGSGEMPTFLQPDQMKDEHIVQPIGASVRLRCKATGKPAPDIVWYKDGVILPGELSAVASVDGSSSHWQLKLADLRIADSGRYTCKAFNKVGAINFTYTVQVVDSKPVIQEIQNSTVVVGDTLVLQCQIYSEEQPKVEWLKRLDRPLSHRRHEQNMTFTIKNERYILVHPGGETMLTKQNTYLKKLVVTRVTEQDGGLYMCSCASSMGLAFQSTYVTVLPGAYSGDRLDDADGSVQTGSAFLPIIIAIATVFGLVLVLVIIVIIHRRHLDNRQKPTLSEISRAPTVSSSLTSPSAGKHHDHHYAVLHPQQPLAPPHQHQPQQQQQQHLLLDNALFHHHHLPTKNYIIDSRSEHSPSLLSKQTTTHPMIHMSGHAYRQHPLH